MANQLFKNFPTLQYKLSDGRVITILDFFRKARIEQVSIPSLTNYTYYEILDGERPDVVAAKLYGDSDLHWTLFLVNEYTNYYQWYLDQESFGLFIDEKYPGQALIAANYSDIINSTSKFVLGEKITTPSGKEGRIIKVEPEHKRICTDAYSFVNGEVVTGSISGKSFTIQSAIWEKDAVEHYENADGFKRNYAGDGWTEVSKYDHEYEYNEERRNIKVIKPEFIKRVVSEFEKVMKN